MDKLAIKQNAMSEDPIRRIAAAQQIANDKEVAKLFGVTQQK